MLRLNSLLFILLIALVKPALAGDDPEQGPEDAPAGTKSWQISVFPFIGTQGVYTNYYIYNLSLNVFAGVTGGVDGVELGGFVNMNRYTMNGLQASGFGNIVNGEVNGVQIAGFFNLNNSRANGFQGAGFVNVINSDADVIQASGFTNVINGNLNGIQATGFANVVSGDSEIQASGFVNVTGGKVTGLQASGFVNVSREIEGLQMAGFVNVAKNVKGMQLGMVNVADSVDGIPIGLLSIVRNGYRKLELSAGDAMNLNLGFKIGVRRFYNFLTLGTQFIGSNSVFSYGYGFGSEVNLRPNEHLNLELMAHRLIDENERLWNHERVNLLNQLRVSYTKDIDARLQFFAGPVLNVLVTSNIEENNVLKDIAPYHMLDFDGTRVNTRMWLGINAGLRFW